MTGTQPYILDASALVELFNGHPAVMNMLADAEVDRFSVVAPAAAVLEAQVVLKATPAMWEYMLDRRVVELPLHGEASVEAGNYARPRLEHHPMCRLLTGPPMVGHVLREAKEMGGAIVTVIPENYGGHDVAVTVLD
ncbi:hypothetical protein [Actinoplanes siamensis]|uniref:PIN domain-containing protein n=1 Tax=Actinoplanes siamensis TaxID=1223317 RepID=A0A919NCE8_9ACTN|nr:hypothetical protein [Actinoplanes siamensis]GIF08267.1 hypothetical protein Asi03nite_58050 [Actinoplanes siamensis]